MKRLLFLAAIPMSYLYKKKGSNDDIFIFLVRGAQAILYLKRAQPPNAVTRDCLIYLPLAMLFCQFIWLVLRSPCRDLLWNYCNQSVRTIKHRWEVIWSVYRELRIKWNLIDPAHDSITMYKMWKSIKYRQWDNWEFNVSKLQQDVSVGGSIVEGLLAIPLKKTFKTKFTQAGITRRKIVTLYSELFIAKPPGHMTKSTFCSIKPTLICHSYIVIKHFAPVHVNSLVQLNK